MAHPAGKEGTKATAAPAEKADGKKKKKKKKKTATPCVLSTGMMLTAMICIASGSLPGAQAFACPAQRKPSVSFGGREVVLHTVYNLLLPTYDAFARNRKYEHPKWVKQVQKDPLREEKRARRVANDLHEEIIEMGQVPRMLSPRTASVGNTAAPVQFSPSPNSWMLDSGSGFDLVGRGDVDLDRLPPIEDLPRPLEVNTANSTVILK